MTLTNFFQDGCGTHCKDSGGRKHAENQKDYCHHHRIHRLNDSRISDEKRNRHAQNDKEKKERESVMDWRHRRSPRRISKDKISRKEKGRIQSHTKEKVEDNRDSPSKHGLQKSEAIKYVRHGFCCNHMVS